ncbi:MAG: 50S ribosomal protein L29 [bacterium]|nr:50S ribosomal protein L29 [bacterium]
MKSKVKKELHSKTIKELEAALKEAKDQLFSIKLEQASKKLKNLRSIFEKRKDIAKIMSILKEKELLNSTPVQSGSKI